MYRVDPSQIRQPENFKDCWILSPTPEEVRPYKILIKKIPISPLAIASQEEIQFSLNPPSSYFQMLNKKDESYFNKNNSNRSNYDFILSSYTGSGAGRVNHYLRNNKNTFLDNELNSYIWCLHKAITENIVNVQNNTVVYRGVKAKIPHNIGIGAKFYFPVFLSSSRDFNIARGFAANGT